VDRVGIGPDGDSELVLEMAGVVFAFNTVNRVADARRVKLEFLFLREFSPIRGWVERRFASQIGLAYDLSHEYQAEHSPEELLDRLGFLFRGSETPADPDVFRLLAQAPLVLEGISGMIVVNALDFGIRPDLWKGAIAIATGSKAMIHSSLRRAVKDLLNQDSLPDCETLLAFGASPGRDSDQDLVSACRQYAWRVSNEAYT
jgi:hypothetical protein